MEGLRVHGPRIEEHGDRALLRQERGHALAQRFPLRCGRCQCEAGDPLYAQELAEHLATSDDNSHAWSILAEPREEERALVLPAERHICCILHKQVSSIPP